MDSFEYWAFIYLDSVTAGLESFESEELKNIQQTFQKIEYYISFLTSVKATKYAYSLSEKSMSVRHVRALRNRDIAKRKFYN